MLALLHAGLFSRRPEKSAEYKEAERSFTTTELKKLEERFRAITDNQGHLGRDRFADLLTINDVDSLLLTRLFDAVAREPNALHISLENLVVAVAHCCKASDAAAEEFCFGILDTRGQGRVSEEDVQKMFAACIRLQLSVDNQLLSEERLKALASGAILQGSGKGEQSLTLAGFQKWNKLNPAAFKTLRAILSTCLSDSGAKKGPPRPNLIVPAVLQEQYGTLKSSLLSYEWMWLLSTALPEKQVVNWELLFSSDVHGKSFNTFYSRAANLGPTITLVRDKNGYLFGGYAAEPWARNGSFYGNASNFIFSLLPTVGIYHPMGVNKNFMYCGHNFQSIPNGFGFGGQVDYWGISVDGTFDHGMSRAAATYANPVLASSEVFEVDTVECWLVERLEEDFPTNARGGTVLDRFKEDQNFMQLAGRKMHSEGHRVEEPLED